MMVDCCRCRRCREPEPACEWRLTRKGCGCLVLQRSPQRWAKWEDVDTFDESKVHVTVDP